MPTDVSFWRRVLDDAKLAVNHPEKLKEGQCEWCGEKSPLVQKRWCVNCALNIAEQRLK